MIVYGINPVLEALRAKRVTRLRVSARTDTRLEAVVALASGQQIGIERVEPALLDRTAHGGVHQGVVADVRPLREYAIADLVRPADGASGGPPPLIVVLDGIEDPHNVGAILRTCDAAGATGVVRQARHSAALDGAVAKASAGAVAHVRIATVVNIARAVDELKEAGVWTIGLAADALVSYTEVDWTVPSAVVLGAEGRGLRRLVRDRCDRVVGIPMLGILESLNVSVAAGVVLYEVVRQRGEKT